MKLILPMLTLILIAGCQTFEREVSTIKVETNANEIVARKYLDHLYSFRFDELEDMVTKNVEFQDSSAFVLQGEPIVLDGRATVISAFRDSADALLSANYNIEKIFVNGPQVVLTLRYNARIKGKELGVNAESVPVSVQAVTVLRIENELVASHIDFVGYEEMLSQISTAHAQ